SFVLDERFARKTIMTKLNPTVHACEMRKLAWRVAIVLDRAQILERFFITAERCKHGLTRNENERAMRGARRCETLERVRELREARFAGHRVELRCRACEIRT